MLELQAVSLRLGQRQVLAGCNLQVRAGERVGLVGSSGAGKSSLLRLAVGALRADAGQCNNGFRHPVLMFQEPRLLPWRSVLDNLCIPLRARGQSAQQARAIARRWLAEVGLADSAHAWPRQLSGGMAQRAALARAFALQPDLLLLDEPFSALDAELRRNLAGLCLQLVERSGAALLYVSHHPQEMGQLVQCCLRLEQGRLLPHALPKHPTTKTPQEASPWATTPSS